ncbi:MAG: flagellin, partial [SAR324 cluster bacterium]|nr:flagellin [SAR324 cluster bacterium]
MPLNITTNSAAASASYYLGKNQSALQKSLNRLASGKKIIAPYDDPGSLSVSMKLQASINRLGGAQNNVKNGISFLEVQDGILAFAGRIVDRMAELKGLSSQDPMKSSLDQASYNDEFKDLQVQLYQMSQQTFNGVSLFAAYTTDADGQPTSTEALFRGGVSRDNTLTLYTSSDGSAGSQVSVHKSTFLSALTIDSSSYNASVFGTTNKYSSSNTTGTVFSFAAASLGTSFTLDSVSVGVFSKALENIASLRAQNGGTMSRLTFSEEMISQMRTNMQAALGRIVDVDLAEESTELAKNQVLVQASAAMLAQAN